MSNKQHQNTDEGDTQCVWGLNIFKAWLHHYAFCSDHAALGGSRDDGRFISDHEEELAELRETFDKAITHLSECKYSDCLRFIYIIAKATSLPGGFIENPIE